tara:strand:- start:4276 stop:7665 length:3390 start_codon:yes stop_codon:yes gene_type:complete
VYQADLLNAETVNNQNIKELSGNVKISKDQTILETQRAILYSDNDQLELFGDILMISDGDTLKCDTLFYYPQSNNIDHFIAAGNVILFNNDQNIYSDSLYYWSEIDSIYASGDVILSDNSTNLNAKSINYWKTDGFYGYSFTANDSVLIKTSNSEIKGMEIIYTDSIQQMSILNNASVIRNNQKLTGDRMIIQFQDSTINKINIHENPIAYNNIQAKTHKDSTISSYRDIMYGELMELYYKDNKLESMKISGMANSLYHIIEDTILDGYNDVSGDTIKLSFINDALTRMHVNGGARGTFYPEPSSSSLDTSIYYTANEIDYIINESQNYFYDNASIYYQDIELLANHIQVDWNSNKLISHTFDGVRPQVKTGSNNNPMVGDTLFYNLISERGIIQKGKTELNNAYYHGEEILNDADENIYTYNGIYTSCDLDEPHFYFFSNRMKIVKDKNIIAKPLILYIRELPVMGFPFAILPNQGGSRKSGWIMPSFGYSEKNGTYFHNLGYYFVVNDFSDMKLLTNFYDRKGFKFNLKLRYKKRYNYNGNVSSILVRDLNRNLENNQNIKEIWYDKKVIESWNFHWTHNHTIDPSQGFFINFNYVSRNDFYQQDQVGYDVNTRLNQQLVSSLTYRKNWQNSNNSLSLNISDSYDLLGEDKPLNGLNQSHFYRTFTLPSISFNHGSRLLFGDGPKWFNSIYYSFNSSIKVRVRKGNVAYESLLDSDGMNYYPPSDTISYQNGVNHKLSITAPQKIFQWFNISPKINLTESWIYGYKEKLKDPSGIFIDDEYKYFSNSLKRRLTGDVSIGLSTKLYGIISAKILSLSAIRHIITPSVTYAYRPDFYQSSIFGMDIDYVQKDNDDNYYDYFSGSLVSSTPNGERETYSFNLKNDFHGKFYTNDSYKKIHLFSFNTNASYNATADSLNWSYLSSSVRTNISNLLNIDLTLKHDLYQLSENGQRINQFSSSPRLVNINSGVQFQLQGKKITGFDGYSMVNDSTSYNQDQSAVDTLDYYQPIISNENLWEADFSFRGSMRPATNPEDEWNKDFWLNSNFDVNLTKQWAISYSMRFDLIDNNILSHSFYIYRQLHCWVFSFRWYPGVSANDYAGSGFQLLIRVKNPDLQDIRVRQTSGNMFGF